MPAKSERLVAHFAPTSVVDGQRCRLDRVLFSFLHLRGEAAVSSRAAPAPELSQLRTTVADLEPPAETAAPLAVAAIPNAEAKAEATAAETAPPKPAKKPKVVKKKVVRVEHHQRGYSGAYAQYGGGWDGWAGGGWSGFQPFGNYRRF